MRRMLLALIVALSLFGLAPVQAQQPPEAKGTVITRVNDWLFGYYWNDHAFTKMAVFASDPQFFTGWFCEGHVEPTNEWMDIGYLTVWINKLQKQGGKVNGPMFARVYQMTEPPTDDAAWCALLTGQTAPLLAEGIAEFQSNSTNDCLWGPGGNTWYQRAVGILSAPTCPSGITRFNMEFHYGMAQGTPQPAYPDCTFDPADIRLLVIRGPNLKCIGR